MRIKSMIAAAALALSAVAGFCQTASAYVLANDNGGDGYVTLTGNGFDLFGSDNGSGPNNTTYTQVATAAQTFSLNYLYRTVDCCGSFYDPAGYVINGTLTQLSPATSAPGFIGGGVANFTVAPGDVFGFYVATSDGVLGRSDITVALSGVPLPASLPMFVAGLFGVFALVQFNNRKKFVA